MRGRLLFLLGIAALAIGCGGGGGNDFGSTNGITNGGNGNGGGTGGINVALQPAAVTLAPGETRQFTANVNGSASTNVRWEASAGNITQTGLYTAPPATGIYQVRAVSKADETKFAVAEVRVEQGIWAWNFDDNVPAFWADRIASTPKGGKFVGRFGGNQWIDITLEGLGAHQSATIEFDLYVIGSFDGTEDLDGLKVVVDGKSHFNKTFSNVAAKLQSYPNGGSPAGTDATATNSLGYTDGGADVINKDAVYRIRLQVPHAASSLRLRFQGRTNEPIANESWGIDNLRLTLNR